jgi:hypothetical protein
MPFSANDSIEILIRAKAEGEAQLKSLGTAATTTDLQIKTLNTTIAALDATMQKSIAAVTKNTSALGETGSAFRKAKTDADDFIKSLNSIVSNPMSSINSPMAAMGRAAQQFAQSLGPVGVGTLALGVGIAAIAVGAFEAAKSLGEFGAQMKGLQIITGLSAAQLGKWDFITKAAGTNIAAVQSTMRGLAVSIEDMSSKGDKGRQWLTKWGVDILAVRDGTADTDDTIRKMGDGLAALTPGVERNAAALDVLKRAGIANLPWLVQIGDLYKRAEDAHKGWSQEAIDADAKLNVDITDLSRSWDDFVRNIEGNAVKAFNELKKLRLAIKEFGDTPLPGGWANGGLGRQKPQETDAQAAKKASDKLLTDSDIAAFNRTKEGLEKQLAAAKSKESEAIKNVALGDVAAIATRQSAHADVERLQGNLDALAERHRLLKELPNDYAKASEAAEVAAAKELGSLAAINAETAKKVADVKRKYQGIGGTKNSTVNDTVAQIQLEGGSRYNKEADKLLDEFDKKTDERLKREAKTFERFQEEVAQFDNEFTKIGIGATGTKERSDISFGNRLSKVNARPGDEAQGIRDNLASAKAILESSTQEQVSQALLLTDTAQILELERLKTQEVQKRTDIEHEAQLAIAELRKKDLQESRAEAGKLFDALLSGKNGFSNFFKSEAKNIGKQIFENVVGEQLNKGDIGSLIGGQRNSDGTLNGLGKGLAGTILGSKGDYGLPTSTSKLTPFNDPTSPLLVSQTKIEDYSSRIAVATEKMATQISGTPTGDTSSVSTAAGGGSTVSASSLGISDSLSGANSASAIFGAAGLLGVGGVAGTSLQTASKSGGLLSRYLSTNTRKNLGNFTSGAFSPSDIWNAGAPTFNPSDGSETPASGARTAGTVVGAAGTVLAGGFAAYQGFSRGGARGALQGTGAILGTAAALDPEPVSKAILAGAAIATGLVTAILGDPIAKRQIAIDKYVSRHQDALPNAISRDLDISGNNINFDRVNNPTSNPTVIHVHVNAMDTQSILDHSHDLASAVQKAMSFNHPILDNVRREFAS